MWSTIIGGTIGGLTGGLTYHEQHPKIKHSWTTERNHHWASKGFSKAKVGPDNYPMQLHHPYGRSGAGFYFYIELTRTEHIQLHKLIGYKNFALPYPYTNFWEVFEPLKYLYGLFK